MVPELPEAIGNNLTPMAGVKINLNAEICVGCGKCTDGVCFVNAIKVKNGKAVINDKKCRVCGRCAEICDNESISIYMTAYAVNRSIKRVERLVNVKSK